MLKLKEGLRFAHHFTLVKLLGMGGFSEVWLAQRESGFLQALKIYTGLDEEGKNVFRREFERVYNLNHDRVLVPSDFGVYENRPYLLMPYCKNGSLAPKVGTLDEREIAKVMLDMASALHYLHNIPGAYIIHQDIKPDNILISNTGNYLLTDFGISTKFRSTLRKSLVTSGRKTKQLDNHMKSSGITPPSYRGPELFDRERNIREPIKSTDIWALGATLYELSTAELPYGEFGGLIQLQNAPPPVLPNQFSKELTIVLQHCMAKETWDRPIAKDLINYAKTYLRSGKWPKLEAPAIPSSPTTSPTVPQGIATIRDGQNDFGRKYGKQSQGNRKNWWWIAALILLLLGGTGGWFFYQQDVSKRADAAYASAEQYFEAKDFFNAKEKY
ncbi:MAG: serine/threonine-protein kinase, partial [Bacteroidota bacterium]